MLHWGWWYGLPLAWLTGTAVAAMAAGAPAAGLWPWVLGLLMVAGLMVVLIRRSARHARARRRVQPHALFGTLTLALVLAGGFGAVATTWRAQQRQAAQWPAALAPRTAVADLWVDSLPTRLAQGGWSLDADVEAWHADLDAATAAARPARASRRTTWGQQRATDAELARLQRVQRVRLYWPDVEMPQPGSHWRVLARWRAPDGAVNPGGMDAEFQAWVRGLGAVGQVASATAVRAMPPSPWWDLRHSAMWDGWRARIRARIQAQVPDVTSAGVLAGLTVGDQSAIDGDEWEVFRRTGVAHLISISGSHIAVVGWWVAWLVRRHWGRSAELAHRWPAPVAAQVLAVAVCTAYAALAGWGLPAQRTVWTMLGVVALRMLGRDWPWGLTGLWVMAWLSLLDPWGLLQPGFWLSFLCVMVLMTAGMAQADRPGAVLGPDAPVTASWGAWAGVRSFTRVQWTLTLAIAPLSLWCFQQVSVVGALVNLGAVPLFDTVITPLALLGIVWSPLWSLDAALIDGALAGLRDASAWSWAVWALPQAPTWLQAWGVVAGLMLAWPGPRGWRWAAGLAMVPLLCLPPSWHLLPPPPAGAFQALALDVGQGTAVLVRTQHHALLFDTGGLIGTRDDAGRRHVLPALQALGVSRLDALVLSHEDADHVGGAHSVLAGVEVVQVLASLPEAHPLRGAGLQRAGRPPIPFGPCTAGLQWVWDGVHIEALHPSSDAWDASPNGHACVLRVQASPVPKRMGPGPSLLLAADVEAAQEARLVAQDARAQALGQASRLRSTVLIAPHHGSATSSTPDFLAAVSPRQVVVQAGRRNRYGHPSAVVTARYEAMGLPWLSTVGCGAWWWDSGDVRAGRVDPNQPAVGSCWQATRHRWWTRPLAVGGQPG